MLVLLAIGFLAGVITAVSPCVLPVLPIVLAGGATGGARRPFAVVGGLVVSFTVFTLAAAALLSALGLPQDFLRDAAIALLFVLAASLVSQRVAFALERPFHALGRRRPGDGAGGFVLGVGLGLVFVPCAGPVLATVTVLAARHDVSSDTVFLTLAYALGAAVPLLAVAAGGQRVSRRLRANGVAFRRAAGVVLAAAAVAIAFGLDTSLQTHLGGYTNALQKHVESTHAARTRLAKLRGGGEAFAASSASGLPKLGPAPEFRGISHWLNTPGDRPVSLASLRGKVVLVDFWTYSCINCLRTLPHLRAWYRMYHRSGLEIVGVHTPEFAFEHVLSNVRGATHDLHVTWPVALDNDYETWDAYANEYWPAEYLVDANGNVRRTHFGEGEYATQERAIRSLLAERHAALPRQTTEVSDATPTELVTPESYLGYQRLDALRYTGTPVRPGMQTYRFGSPIAQNSLSYAGTWRLTAQRAVAGRDARLRLHFHARNVYLVLGGRGRVETFVAGRRGRTVAVTGDRLYTLVSSSRVRDALLELRFSRGVDAYAFTFG